MEIIDIELVNSYIKITSNKDSIYYRSYDFKFWSGYPCNNNEIKNLNGQELYDALIKYEDYFYQPIIDSLSNKLKIIIRKNKILNLLNSDNII